MIPQAKKLDADMAYKYHAQFQSYKNADYDNYLADCKKNDQYYYNEQWTEADLQKMEDRNQYAITLNRIKKYVTAINGMMTAEKPTFRAMPFGSEDAAMSKIANMILSHVYNNSKGPLSVSRISKSALRSNIGYFLIKPDQRNRVVFEFQPPDRILVDPDSRDPFFDDAYGIYYYDYIPIDIVCTTFNIDKKDLVTETPDEWSQMYASDNNTIKIGPILHESKSYIRVIEGYHREIKHVVIDGKKTGETKQIIKKRILVGYQHMWEETLPDCISEYPILPLYYDDTGNTYKRGLVYFLKDLQTFLNKVFGVMILNAQMMSNPKVLVWKHNLLNGDVEAFRKDFTRPGAIIGLEGDPKESMAPQIITGQQINSAWYQIVIMLMQELEFNTIPNQAIGMDVGAETRSGSQIFQQYQAMMNSFREYLTTIDAFFTSLAKRTLQYFMGYTTQYDMSKVFGLDEVSKRFQEYRAQQLDPTNSKSIEEWAKQQQEKKVNAFKIEETLMNAKKDIDFINKVKYIMENKNFAEFDIVTEKGSYLSSHSMLSMMLKVDLLKLGVVDQQSVLEDSPIDNKKEILERMSITKRAIQDNEMLTAQIEDSKQMIDKLENELRAARNEVMDIEHETKLDKEAVRVRTAGSARLKIDSAMRSVREREKAIEDEKRINDAVLQLKDATLTAKKNKPDNGGYSVEDNIRRILAEEEE